MRTTLLCRTEEQARKLSEKRENEHYLEGVQLPEELKIRVLGGVEEDLVWTYEDPAHDADAVRELVCFFNERVDIEVDGVVGERPRTQWSRD